MVATTPGQSAPPASWKKICAWMWRCGWGKSSNSGSPVRTWFSPAADDSFIPLEERTAIANEAHADLFISIHANSSQDHGARGIETYYLNLKGSPEAMEVAARENAVSNVGIHDLEDLVKKIARNEKIDESREFAEDIQTPCHSACRRPIKP